jgi:hypothetical protein
MKTSSHTAGFTEIGHATLIRDWLKLAIPVIAAPDGRST